MTAARWDVSREAYHADRECVSSSGLRLFAECPQEFRLRQLGLVETGPGTDATDIGEAVHSHWLEPDAWLRTWAYAPAFGDQRRTENKQRKAEWALSTGDRRILDHEDALTASGCVKALAANPWAESIRKAPGENELPIRWECPETGVWCRALVDLHRPTIKIAGDLKTIAGRPTEAACSDAIQDYRLDVQAVHYLAGLKAVFGLDPEWVWIFAGKSPPHVAVVYGLDQRTREIAERQRLTWLRELRRCQEEDDWLRPIGRPERALRQDEYQTRG
jgi:hypothetical protein